MAGAGMWALLGLDINPFKRGLDGAQALAAKAGPKFSQAFGTGMVAGFAAHKIQGILTAPFERANEISENASKLKITGEEYQMLEMAAQAAGMTVDEFITSMQETPGGADAAIAALEQYRKQVQLTNEDVDRLKESNVFADAGKKVTGWTAKALKRFENFATKMFDGWVGGTGHISDADIARDDAEQRRDSSAPSGNLGKVFDPKSTGGSGGASNAATNPLSSVGAIQQQITGRQSIGAFVASGPSIVSEVQKQTKAVETMTSEVKDMRDALERVTA